MPKYQATYIACPDTMEGEAIREWEGEAEDELECFELIDNEDYYFHRLLLLEEVEE